ncbi:MAG TPA: ribonuclease R [Polyangiaceae bacterium]|nr:ribonuclease R [Polyangiaceae bacterium]
MSFDPTDPVARAPAALSHAIVDLLGSAKRAMHVAEIGQRLAVGDRARLRDALDALVDDGIVLPQAGQRFRLSPGARPAVAPVEGMIHVNPKGFAFVRPSGETDDVYIPADAVAGAMHGDRVAVRVVARSRRGREGEIVAVLERRCRRVVGTLEGRPGQRYLEPDDARIRGPVQIVDEGSVSGARPGLAAVVAITQYPEESRENPQGRLVQVLGVPGEPDVEVAKVLAAHAIDEQHPSDALREAQAYGETVDPAELANREDLTSIPLLTIDPHNARDHDDAVWVTRDEGGSYQAWIAIADVSHYVTPDSGLDRCALERGCSVYLPDRAVPMLPATLSSVLCSLLSGQERLCLCVHIELDPTGSVRRSRIIEGRMRSRAFLSYHAVARALGFTTNPEPDPVAEAMRDDLFVLWDLAMILRKRRMRRGALDLEIPEAEIAIDMATRLPVSVTQREHDPGVRKAYRLVEELMLLANETVARFCLDRSLPAIYRVHAAPEPEKLARYAEVCGLLGVDFDPEDGTDPQKLTRFLRKIGNHPRREILHMLLLRALTQACYDPTNIGHFGLASGAYLHFTSPIRRYPDLVVHRVVRQALRGEKPARDDASAEALRRAALLASEQERNAMEAEREVTDVYRALLMRSHIGKTFEGTVSSVTPIGLWTRLTDPFVDVLVPLDALGHDAYEVDDAGLRASGVRSGDSITLGDKLVVLIEDVSLVRRLVFARRVLDDQPRRKSRSTKKERKEQRRAAAKKARGRTKKTRKKSRR